MNGRFINTFNIQFHALGHALNQVKSQVYSIAISITARKQIDKQVNNLLDEASSKGLLDDILETFSPDILTLFNGEELNVIESQNIKYEELAYEYVDTLLEYIDIYENNGTLIVVRDSIREKLILNQNLIMTIDQTIREMYQIQENLTILQDKINKLDMRREKLLPKNDK